VTTDSAEQYTAWTTGKLVFHDAPLTELLESVSRWYGVRFAILDTELARRRVTATVDFGSRAELMHALMLILDVRMSFSDASDSLILVQRRRDSSTVAPMPRSPMHLFSNPREVGR